MVLSPIRAAFVAIAVLAGTCSGPALAEDSFRSILEADAAKIDGALKLEGDDAVALSAILEAGVAQRLVVLDKLGVVYGGEAPNYATLLLLQAQMDALRASEREEVSTFLTEDQMKTVDELGSRAEEEFRVLLVGDS